MRYIHEECPNDVFLTDFLLEVVDGHFCQEEQNIIHICHVPPAPFQWSSQGVVGFHSCCVFVRRWPPYCMMVLWYSCFLSSSVPCAYQSVFSVRKEAILSTRRSIAASHHRQVVAGLRQFIEAIYADHPGATTIEVPRWWRFGCGVCRD